MARINYASWPIKKLKVSNLRLDPKNPRIPFFLENRSTKSLLEYLIKEENVLQLAKKIVTKGFFCQEPIYVTKEDGKYVVLEGNRRVASLKCLLNQDLLPARKASAFKKLQDSLPESEWIKSIDVVVAPSREVLEDLLFEIHTVGKKEWDRPEKGAYIARSFVEDGKSIKAIASQSGIAQNDVKTFILEYYAIAYALRLNLDEKVREVIETGKFSASNLSRVIGCDEFKGKTGLALNDKKLKTDLNKNKFDFYFNIIVSDIALNKQNSRTLNDNDQLTKYIDDVFKQGVVDGDDDEIVDFSPRDDTPKKPLSKPEVKPKPKPAKVMLVDKETQYVTGSDKLDDILKEAQGIQLGQYVYSSAFLLRNILELSIVRIFELHGEESLCINDNGRVKQLSQNVRELKKKKDWFNDATHYSEFDKFSNNENESWNRIETLNQYVHGTCTAPDKTSLRSLWFMIKPLVLMCVEAKESE